MAYYRQRDETPPPRPFTTDGCSGGMSWFWQHLVKPFSKTDLPWRGCCISHDREYWMGGTWQQRRAADLQLFKCVKQKGFPLLAWFMYTGVRMGGSPFWPFGWRWAYGYKNPLFSMFKR